MHAPRWGAHSTYPPPNPPHALRRRALYSSVSFAPTNTLLVRHQPIDTTQLTARQHVERHIPITLCEVPHRPPASQGMGGN